MGFERHKTNLIEWFHFENPRTGSPRDTAVLLLGEKEDTEFFAEFLKTRVTRLSARLDDASYDAIIIPVLTRRVLRLFQGDLTRMFRSLSDTWLNEGGRIFVGIENEKDIDRLAGAEKSGETLYLNLRTLKTLRGTLREAYPDSADMLYFPMPELEMPMCLYSEQRLPQQGEEAARYNGILADGQFQDFAPAYLYVFEPDRSGENAEKKKRDLTPVYIKYNSSRKPEYAIKTLILKDEQGILHVRKESLTREANPHVEQLTKNAAAVEAANPAVKVLAAEEVKKTRGLGEELSYIQYPFVKGRSLADILADMIQKGEAPVKEIRESMELVIGAAEGTVNPANLDGLFSNVLMNGDVLTLIDCEWVSAEDTEVRFLEYRMLKYWYEEFASRLSYGKMDDFLRLFGFTMKESQQYAGQEEKFQELIHGDGAESNVYAYRKSRMTLDNFRELRDANEDCRKQIAYLKSEVAERDVTLKKEREVSRLTHVHVSNLENIIRIHERDIANLQHDLAYFQAHQNLYCKLKGRIDSKYTQHFPVGSRKRRIMGYIGRTLLHPGRMLPMYFSADGRNRIHGDFHVSPEYPATGKLHFEKTETPLVSIVLPCYNQIAYTYQCLRSIYEHTDPAKTPYEIIIADDVSTDATREINLYADNLVIARNKENQGFLRNCNQAAAIARGQYIFFLNNDTTVTDGWLESLVSLISSDPSIGMVGSKLVYPDGRLQEAGGIIWSDGSGWNYGRLGDPADPEYNYVKDVDFISGAAIMIRTSLWQEIEGFDVTFAPAYYEDVDLAFEVRRHGRRVVYQPASVVVHYEGVSNGTDTGGTGLKRYQVVNQHKFCTKWEVELKHQSVNTGNPNPFKARERGQNSPYVLFVEHYVPTWDKDAGSKLDYQYIQLLLSKGFRIKYLGDNFQHEEPYTSLLEQMGVEVLYGPKYESGIWDWITKNESMINIAYLNRPHIAAKYIDFLRENTNIKIIFFGCDLHSLREMREYKVTGDEKILEDAEYWKSVEYSVMRKADMSYYPSLVEEQVIKAEDPAIRVKAITAFIYAEKAKILDNYAEREGLLFVGGFGHPPNKDGVMWFVQSIYPEIRKALPDVTFRIVGSHVDEEIQALDGRDGISVLGFVSDERLAALYQENRIVVVPLRFGAGIKGKVVDALYNGAAVVTTSVGAEGITNAADVLKIEDSEADFAAEVIRLYKDPEEIRRMSGNASAFIERNYSPEGAWNIIRPDFETGIEGEK